MASSTSTTSNNNNATSSKPSTLESLLTKIVRLTQKLAAVPASANEQAHDQDDGKSMSAKQTALQIAMVEILLTSSLFATDDINFFEVTVLTDRHVMLAVKLIEQACSTNAAVCKYLLTCSRTLQLITFMSQCLQVYYLPPFLPSIFAILTLVLRAPVTLAKAKESKYLSIKYIYISCVLMRIATFLSDMEGVAAGTFVAVADVNTAASSASTSTLPTSAPAQTSATDPSFSKVDLYHHLLSFLDALTLYPEARHPYWELELPALTIDSPSSSSSASSPSVQPPHLCLPAVSTSTAPATVSANATAAAEPPAQGVQRCALSLDGHERAAVLALKESSCAGIFSLISGLTLRPSSSGPNNGPITFNTSANAASGVNLPDSVLQLLISSFKILNNVARINLELVQEFGQEYQTPLYHIIFFLLDYLTSHYSSRDGGGDLIGQCLEQLLLFIGHYTFSNHHNQAVFRWGQTPNLLQRLCNLPFAFFSDVRAKALLFPTLLSVCFLNIPNKRILSGEIHCQLLVSFLEQEIASLKKHSTATKEKEVAARENEKESTGAASTAAATPADHSVSSSTTTSTTTTTTTAASPAASAATTTSVSSNKESGVKCERNQEELALRFRFPGIPPSFFFVFSFCLSCFLLLFFSSSSCSVVPIFLPV